MKNLQNQSTPEKESVFVRKVWLSPIFYLYFLSVLVALGMLYIHRENMVNRNSIPPDIAVDSVYDAPIYQSQPAQSNGDEKIDLSAVLKPTKAQLDKGGQLFKIDCATCHGTDGKGDGPASASLNPKPRDFHSTVGWKNGRLLSQMFKTVSEGVPGSAMVSFAASLTPSDRIAIIDYIRTTFGDFPNDTPEQLTAMSNTYHLNAPQAQLSHIPIAAAMKETEESAIQQVRTTDEAAYYLSQHSGEPGGRLFSSVMSDERRALTSLAASEFWSKNQTFFVTMIAANTVQNGFDPRVAQLSGQDWQTLYNYLKDAFTSKATKSGNG